MPLKRRLYLLETTRKADRCICLFTFYAYADELEDRVEEILKEHPGHEFDNVRNLEHGFVMTFRRLEPEQEQENENM